MVGPALLAVIVVGLLAVMFSARVHVTCSRAADRCLWEVQGIDASHGTVRLSTVGTLTAERRGATSRLTFATTNGRVPVGNTWDDGYVAERATLAAHFTAFLMGHDETFDDGFGPSPALLLLVVATLAGAVLWVARGGPRASVTVDPESETVTVVSRDKPWAAAQKRILARARMREWRGGYELYDEAGTVVSLPTGPRHARARTLEASLDVPFVPSAAVLRDDPSPDP